MKRESTQWFEDSPLTIENKLELSAATIDSCLNESSRYIEYQWDSIKNIRQNSTMLITVLLAMLVSFVGSYLATIETAPLLVSIISIIGIIACGFPIGVLAYGIFYKKMIFHPGDSPSHYLRPEHLQWLKDMKEWNPELYDEDKYLRLLFLRDQQLNIMDNKKEKRAQVRYYRLALYITFATAILLVSLFLLLFWII